MSVTTSPSTADMPEPATTARPPPCWQPATSSSGGTSRTDSSSGTRAAQVLECGIESLEQTVAQPDFVGQLAKVGGADVEILLFQDFTQEFPILRCRLFLVLFLRRGFGSHEIE